MPLSDIAENYLHARNCAIPPKDGDLRCHASLSHPYCEYIGPALVARVTDAITNEPMTLHQTWIRPDGKKANIETPRLLLKDHQKEGGVVRLWPDEELTHGLAIAEGIETALSASFGFSPIWSLIDGQNLSNFPVLQGVEALTIIADNDNAGRSAAHKCLKRWLAAGREVRLLIGEPTVLAFMVGCVHCSICLLKGGPDCHTNFGQTHNYAFRVHDLRCQD